MVKSGYSFSVKIGFNVRTRFGTHTAILLEDARLPDREVRGMRLVREVIFEREKVKRRKDYQKSESRL